MKLSEHIAWAGQSDIAGHGGWAQVRPTGHLLGKSIRGGGAGFMSLFVQQEAVLSESLSLGDTDQV